MNWMSLEWNPELEQYGFGFSLIGSLLLLMLTTPILLIIGWLWAYQFVEKESNFKILSLLSKIVMEALNSLPSVIIGVWAISYLVPLVREVTGTGYCLLTASIGLVLFLAPGTGLLFVIIYKDYKRTYGDLAHSYKMGFWENSLYCYQAYRREFYNTTTYLICRLLSETMIVLMLSGNILQIPTSIFDGVRTMTATIALEVPYATDQHEQALFGLSAVSMIMVFIIGYLLSNLLRPSNKTRLKSSLPRKILSHAKI